MAGQRRRRAWRVTARPLARLAGLAATTLAALTPACSATIKDDETVVLFPTAAQLDSAADVWEIPIHGWVFEVEDDSLWRAGLVHGAAAALGLDAEAEENEYFQQRAWMFLLDNERGKVVRVAIGPGVFATGESGANGHVSGIARIARADLADVEKDGWVRLEAVLPADDPRRFTGGAQLLEPGGLSVISDIDDTIKVSEVTDTQALLANTFLRAFRPVPGMADLYRSWAASGAAFHYLSSSPWQLYPALDGFLDREGYPPGSFHLRQFRLKDESVLNLFQAPEAHKIPAIEAVLDTFPGRLFILVGDSGERDPEIYGEVARRYPGQIGHVLIRDVGGDADLARRLEAAFRGVPTSRWTAFRDPAELAGLRIR